MRSPEKDLRLGAYFGVRDGYVPRRVPITRVRPHGPWLTHSSREWRSSQLHLVDFALAAWLDTGTAFVARAKCRWITQTAAFHIEPPHYDLCDKCVFIDGAKPTVYRYFDAAGDLLYVGYTTRPGVRMLAHAREADWFPAVRSYRLVEYADHANAKRAECHAIEREWPKHNRRTKLARRFQVREIAFPPAGAS